MSFNNFALSISRKLQPEYSNMFSMKALKLIYNLGNHCLPDYLLAVVFYVFFYQA